MSEGDVSLIRDEDVLRRMWQQTEDFSRKKEIRAHMYRLREERLRNLYSPEPFSEGKGVDSAQIHVKSLLDQSFQGLKSKEVRDAGSPPKDFTYRGQDLKELSNAGWNVESENRTTDDGHTHVKSVNANIEGKYDVEGGRGQFSAVDHHKQAVTEYHDDNSSLKRNESSSNTAAHEEVVRKTDDGSHFSSTTNSSSTTKFQQVSSTKHEVPYSNDDYDLSRDTNRNEEVRQIIKTNDYEQNLRSNYDSGELVSRKIDYPDGNTKVIVETRLLPDGTRVTSTRREFRVPVQSTRSEQHSQTKTENKSYTSSRRSDVKSSRNIHNFDTKSDIVDSQRQIDDYDFKRNQIESTNQTKDIHTQRINQQTSETKQSDTRQTSSKIIHEKNDNRNDVIESHRQVDDNSNIQRSHHVEHSSQTSDYSTTERRTNCYESKDYESDRHEIRKQQFDYDTNNKVDETDSRNTVSGDHQNIHRDIKETQYVKDNKDYTQSSKNLKNEELIEKKISSDQYQTTYQTDFTQKKITNDWSPSHQAWASTLRADTPSSIRPTTRASSPGSTSSLRSSVSPDKTYRKTPSRGGSPNKCDRYSPSRSTTNNHSSTHSTHSVTETNTNRYTSPDKKPPMSPTRHGGSPDRKPQRSSQSPEKRSQSSPSSSPDRKLVNQGVRTQSPYKSVSPDKQIPKDATKFGPDRKTGYKTPEENTSKYPRDISPMKSHSRDSPRHSSSPERKSTNIQISPTRTYSKKSPANEHAKEFTPDSGSTDRKPGYMSPTASKSDTTSPNKYTSPDRKSPVKHVPSLSPERKSSNKITTAKEDHYKFVDEETKMYIRSSQDDSNYTEQIICSSPNRSQDSQNKSPSPIRKSPIRPSIRKDSRSPSPPKGPVSFTHDDEIHNYTEIDIKIRDGDNHIDILKQRSSPERDPSDRNISRETSPNKYGTYDKRENVEITTINSKITDNVNYDLQNRSVKTSKEFPDSPESHGKKSPKDKVPRVESPNEPSPNKYGTYDKKRRSEEVEEMLNITTKDMKDTEYDSLTRRDKPSSKKISDVPASPVKKSPRNSISPTKSPTKYTTNFISTERTTEEMNKTTTTKDRSRQLITPSTSPTRKPKTNETAPSTGQSSPTTSVSGFVYFSSPKTERTIVTDLDDVDFNTDTNITNVTTMYKRPDTLDVERRSSPSKIPCRSPSPEKRISPTKDGIPRKSSLKKSSIDSYQLSPIEKPPSSFRVSPTDESSNFPEHKVVKKDRPVEPIPAKPKPPLERRETYEDRCRKILGMAVDDNTMNIKKTGSNLSSPSVSPCHSPEAREPSPSNDVQKNVSTKLSVTDFINREQQDTISKSSTDQDHTISIEKKYKTPSRDNSPTQVQNMSSNNTINNTTAETEIQTVRYQKSKDEKSKHEKNYVSSARTHISPEKTPPKNTTVSQLTYSSDKKPSPTDSGVLKQQHGSKRTLPFKEFPEKMSNENSSKEIPLETRSSVSPDRKPGYMKSTAATTTRFELTTTTMEDTQENVRKTKDQNLAKETSSAHSRPLYSKHTITTEQYTGPEQKHNNNEPTSVSSDRKPGYMKPTTTSISKFESTTESANQDVIATNIRQSPDRETGCPRTIPQSKPKIEGPLRRSISPEHKPKYQQPSPTESLQNKQTNENITRPSGSPEKNPGYMKSTAATTQKYEENSFSENLKSGNIKHETPKSKIPQQSTSKKSDEQKHSRTPSPTKSVKKTTTGVVEDITEFIQSEREQEILDRVQKSLRRLSPNRDQRSPSRERSPGKTTISLQDLDLTGETVISDKFIAEDDVKSHENQTIDKTDFPHPEKLKNNRPENRKPITKVPSRNVSPTKKSTVITPSKSDKNYEPSSKCRSISPKKPISSIERPQSPQISRTSNEKSKESTHSQLKKPNTGNISPTKIEKPATDIKKPSVTKQNSFSKTTSTKLSPTKITSPKEPDIKRSPTPKGVNKENVSPKKDETKVTRTASDTTIKTKKTSPQRMRSKPEIQIDDSSTKSKHTITSNTISKKTNVNEPHTKLAPKPKSATALNTSMKDDDNIIIDVEQAKSSRENSPDRICPTPVNFVDDIDTPRFPDEISEPDDEFRKRTYHTIHETESVVDDIVEICEDEELFVKRTDVDRITESDECLLSVTDKVSKFTDKIDTINKAKDTTTQFSETERRVHSDFTSGNLKSDECLLSVSEKVNKFAKGTEDTKDSRSPARRIVDEYDTGTIYQDDYTKLSVNDKAHLFIETAENIKAPKMKPSQKVQRPDLSNVDESLKSDDCLLSVSDKVNKFVKTAEQFLNEGVDVEDKEKQVKDEYEKIMKHIIQDEDDNSRIFKTNLITEEVKNPEKKTTENKTPSFAKETTSSHTKVKDYVNPNIKPSERTPTVKITTLRSSEAVKKAKALFENIASTTQKSQETRTAKLTDIGVIKKSPKTDSTVVLHPSLEDGSPNVTDVDSEVDAPVTKNRPSSATRPHHTSRYEEKPSSPTRLKTQSPEIPRNMSPLRQSVVTTTSTNTILTKYTTTQNNSPRNLDSEKNDRPQDKTTKHELKSSKPDSEKEKVPSYQRPTKTSQIKEEKTLEETEVSTRRGSGKFGVELRRTSIERTTVSSDRRRSSTDHHQPCIEDIFDLDLLEQMLEKVVGYEQRRRIRAQIRIAKKKMETEHTDTTHTKTSKQIITTKTRSPERRHVIKSPERQPKGVQKTPENKSTPQKTTPHESDQCKDQIKLLLNGHAKEPSNLSDKRQRPQSPEKPRPTQKTKRSVRPSSPEKKTRPLSPSKTPTKPKMNRFNEYASAYMKKVGLNETDKVKFTEVKMKRHKVEDDKLDHIATELSNETEVYESNDFEEKVETKTTMSKNLTERTSSRDTIEIIQINGKRSPSPSKKYTPERQAQSPSERLYYRSPSPDFKRPKSDKKETIIRTVYETEPIITKKETIIKTVYEERPKTDIKKETVIKNVYDIDKKTLSKQVQEEKPSWVTNRNLKKISNDSRTFSSKKIESEKPKYRAASPSKAIAKPIDVITSSYGPGPLDADGKPLFGIKALRNGATNYQVKGTVIRQEFHSRNGSEPEGTVSVTAYSTEPEDLERLLQTQGEKPSRIHGLAAITTTKKFGGDTGTTLKEAHSKEERASLEQFTHSDRRVTDSRVTNLSETRSFDTTRDDTRTTDRSIDYKKDTRATERRSQERREKELKETKRMEDRRERVEKREDKKTVRQSSVKSLTEKYIKSASDTSKSERVAYPKAGLILRTSNMKDSISSDSSAHAGLGRTDSEHSLGSVDDSHVEVTTTTEQLPDGQRTTTTTTRSSHKAQERSFLDSSTKVTGVQDILTRMKNADIVIQDGDTSEDTEARALLNKFLGATVLMAGMQGYVTEKPSGKIHVKQETVRSTSKPSRTADLDIDIEQCWDERVLRKLLEESSDYEQRRRLRARIRALMAEQEACASAVTDALGAAGEAPDTPESTEAREEKEVTVTSSVRRNSSEKTVSSSTTTKTSKVIESMTRPAPKPVSPFAKFRQLEKQNSNNSPNSPQTPKSPGSPAQPYFKFTDPALQCSALTIKERLLQWCRDKTRDYENVKLENFSTSWADGLAFCALLHHFLPDAFDYSKLTPDKRRHNFTLAFKIADEKAGIYPLLDVDDMVAMRKPDWKCVFTYVQSIHRRFKDQS